MSTLGDLLGARPRNRRRVEKEPRFRLPAVEWRRFGPAALGLVALAALAAALALALDRPVRTVTVAGAFQRVSPLDVERVVRARLEGGFLTANLDELQAAIETLPWVDRARVQRRWPGGLVVGVTEQVPAARWGAGGLLNMRGELFIEEARHVPPELPSLDGPAGTEREVAELYFQLYPRLLETGLRISALRLDARGAWELDLANGATVRFGRRQLQERIERFLKAGAPLVASRQTEIAFVDMRYSNGFSIGWRTQGAPAARPAAADEERDAGQRDADQDQDA